MTRVPYLKSGIIACICVIFVLSALMLWSHFEYNDGFPNFNQFQIYSVAAFLAITIITSVLIEHRVRYWRSAIILFPSGFLIFLTVGSYRYLFNGVYETWISAISGSSNLLSSIVLNGGFLSLVAIVSYTLAKATVSVFQNQHNGATSQRASS